MHVMYLQACHYELTRDGYSWAPMSPQQMATLIDHITRTDAQIEGRGFFILNKEMATTVRTQLLQKKKKHLSL